MTAQTINYQALAQAMLREMGGRAASFKDAGSTPNIVQPHGPGGLFSYPGLSNQLFSAMLIPQSGVQAELPVRPSADMNPLYGILTGVTASTGSEPTNVCDDPPYAGLAKLCTHSFLFNRFSRKSRIIDISSVGRTTNRGEMLDLNLLNPPASPNAPAPTRQSPMMNAASKALFELGVAMSRDTMYEFYTGNPSNNTAGGGRKYFYGLDILVNTGYKDAVTGQLCPAADSLVRNFSSADVASNGTALVQQITNIMRLLRHKAKQTGLDPVLWKIAMPASMFYEVTAIWPCSYETYRCVTGDTSRERFVNDRQFLNNMTTEMRGNLYDRTGQFLWVDGQRVPVVLDDAITETVLAGESFTASMYFLPYTVLGGTPSLLLEHIDYDAPNNAMDVARQMAPMMGQDGSYFTSDGGRFLWHKKPPSNWCVETLVLFESRLLLLTPQVAARLINVKYTPFKHEASWDPASSFYANGGRTDYVGFGPSFYPPQ